MLVFSGMSLTTRAATVTWDISKGPLIIAGNSTDHYVITGTTTTNYVEIEAGYKGVITLRQVNISITGGNHSPITVKGQNDCSNLTPVTIVDVILEGENILKYTSGEGDDCGKEWRSGCLEWKKELQAVTYTDCIAWEEKKDWYLGTVCVRWEERRESYMGKVCTKWVEVERDGNFYMECVEEKDELIEYTYEECVEEKDELIEFTYEECVKSVDRVEMEWVTTTECLSYGEGWFDCPGWCDGHAAFHVDQGAQINIMSVDPSNDASGTLYAASFGDGAAGIGASYNDLVDQATAEVNIIGNCQSPATTAGGNIVISSGTVDAYGGRHAAGIGGGWKAYYDGMIVIYGGTVSSSASFHAAGIGSGCPTEQGIVQCYTPNGAVIVLPPAKISAIGAGNAIEGLRPDLGLAGADNIIYIGDPAKPVNYVHTEDFVPNANIYVDLSESPNIAKVINAIVPVDRLDINKVKFGNAGSDGMFKFHGIINDYVTFFTDAQSLNPQKAGRPYLAKRILLNESAVNRTAILELLNAEITIESVPSIPLVVGYTASEAFANAFRIKISYVDQLSIENVTFEVAGGTTSDFSIAGMKFYASDGITEIPVPTSLKGGDVIYVSIPVETGKPVDSYADVFRFIGTISGQSTGYIRIVITQEVTPPNTITVTASLDEGGTVTGSGIYATGVDVTVTATPKPGYGFMYWAIDGVEVSGDASYTFTVSESTSLTAVFEPYYRVNVEVNDSDYGAATGAGLYEVNAYAQVEAKVGSCYRFANWTINGVVASVDNPYTFTSKTDVTIVANFYALDFDTYAPTLWDNTFMLNLKKLEEDNYKVTGCTWFKNEKEEKETRTVSEFSYSAGDHVSDRVDVSPAYYMFRLTTENHGDLCSTKKMVISYKFFTKSADAGIVVYPNPLPAGSQLYIEDVISGSPVYVYNQAGICVYTSVAGGDKFSLTLPVPAGIYMIRIGDQAVKIVVTN